jgi:hypothetical protein
MPAAGSFRLGAFAICIAAIPAGHAQMAVSVYAGISNTRSSDLHIAQPETLSDATFSPVTWKGKPFEDAPYYGLRVTYVPPRLSRVGISLDFTHYKMYARTDRNASVNGSWNGAPVDTYDPIQARVSSLEISHGVNLTALDIEYYPMKVPGISLSNRWLPYVGAGLVAYVPHAEGAINGLPGSADYQLAGWGYQLLAGTRYRVSRRLSLLVEAKFDAGSLEIDMTPRTRIDTDTRTAHLLVGLTWGHSPSTPE